MLVLPECAVLSDREAAQEVADLPAGRFPLPEEPRPVRKAPAGEDDAEDAHGSTPGMKLWGMAVVEDPRGDLDRADLDAVAAEFDGWLE